tara:strand:+ start:18 stop:338 length:321 start_codon:yes stop_codon:yes gene_type:complete
MKITSLQIRKIVRYKFRHKHGIRLPQRIAELIVPVVMEIIGESILRSDRVYMGRIGYFNGAKTPTKKANLYFTKRNTFVFSEKFAAKLKQERSHTDIEEELRDEHR